jgi:hypothetical protein
MFNPNGNIQRQSEDWAIAAMRNSRSGNLQYLVILGIVGSFGIASLAGIPLGIFSFTCFMVYGMGKASESQINQSAIQEFGCVANVLEGMDFKAFRAQVGDEEVARQLIFAQVNGLPIKKDGVKFMANFEIPVQAEIIPSDVQHSVKDRITQAVSTTSEDKVPDIAREMAERLKPTLVVGVPGAGKDVLVWNAVELIKQSGKKVYVFAVDPKCDVKEFPYFQGRVDKLYSLDFNSKAPEDCFKFLQDALEEYENFDSQGNPKLLIFNELNATTKVLKSVEGGMKWLEKKLTFYSSSGRTRGWILWAISQTAHEKGLGFGGETRPIFIKIVLITLDNLDAAVDILRAQIIAKEQKPSPQELKKICDRSPVGVAVYHGSFQKWFPQAKMRDFLAEVSESKAKT